jgi:hypothetical protein
MRVSQTCILTFPRSGSNLLENTLEAMGMFRLSKSHSCWDASKKYVITIARDPLDSLTSFAAMRMHYRDGNIGKNIVAQYCSTYQYLINNANVVIDYNDLVSDPHKVTGNLIVHLGKNVYFKTPRIRRNKDAENRKYLVSSAGSDQYPIAKELMEMEDLSRCYELYNKLLSLKTEFAQ